MSIFFFNLCDQTPLNEKNIKYNKIVCALFVQMFLICCYRPHVDSLSCAHSFIRLLLDPEKIPPRLRIPLSLTPPSPPTSAFSISLFFPFFNSTKISIFKYFAGTEHRKEKTKYFSHLLPAQKVKQTKDYISTEPHAEERHHTFNCRFLEIIKSNTHTQKKKKKSSKSVSFSFKEIQKYKDAGPTSKDSKTGRHAARSTRNIPFSVFFSPTGHQLIHFFPFRTYTFPIFTFHFFFSPFQKYYSLKEKKNPEDPISVVEHKTK